MLVNRYKKVATAVAACLLAECNSQENSQLYTKIIEIENYYKIKKMNLRINLDNRVVSWMV